MASSSRSTPLEEDDDVEEEVQHFDDFTLASSWERFISDIEATCHQWLADGPENLVEKGAVAMEDSKNLFRVKHELKNVEKSYCMEFYFQIDNNGSQQAGIGNWNSNSHDLQLCFGVKDFLLIAPQSASGVLLATPESSKLLSAVAIALSNCGRFIWNSAKEKSPSLDDGGDGFPPRDDGDGGGGGGGGGNWSGGFFFFGFLAFLGLLKDKEGEEDYRGSRRR